MQYCTAAAASAQEFHVSLLHDSPLHVPKLSAKATGEPPMLLSAAVLCALQDAVDAAWREHTTTQQDQQQQQQEAEEEEEQHEGSRPLVKQDCVKDPRKATRSQCSARNGYAGVTGGSSSSDGEVAVAAVVNVPATSASLKEVLPPVFEPLRG